MPMRSELRVSSLDLDDRQSASDAWPAIVTTISDPEFAMIALFCAVGLWLTFYGLHVLQRVATFGPFL
jgi:hypothetical protein